MFNDSSFRGKYKGIPFFGSGQFVFLHWCFLNNKKVKQNKEALYSDNKRFKRIPNYYLPEDNVYVDVRPFKQSRSDSVNNRAHKANVMVAKAHSNFTHLYEESMEIPSDVSITRILVEDYHGKKQITLTKGMNLHAVVIKKNRKPVVVGLPRWFRSFLRKNRAAKVKSEPVKISEVRTDGNRNIQEFFETWKGMLNQKKVEDITHYISLQAQIENNELVEITKLYELDCPKIFVVNDHMEEGDDNKDNKALNFLAKGAISSCRENLNGLYDLGIKFTLNYDSFTELTITLVSLTAKHLESEPV